MPGALLAPWSSAGVAGSQGLEKQVGRRALWDERIGTGHQRALGQLVCKAVRDDLDLRPSRLDPGRRCDAVQTRHADIQDDNIGAQPLDFRYSLLAIDCLADQLDSWLCGQKSAQRSARARSIVGNQEPTDAKLGAAGGGHTL
ncbi:MAG TPA: hypothetical protein VFB50_13450 [Chloroflexota bacterium]|nr:hypothetical protein [Chloroflexota bacterium]